MKGKVKDRIKEPFVPVERIDTIRHRIASLLLVHPRYGPTDVGRVEDPGKRDLRSP